MTRMQLRSVRVGRIGCAIGLVILIQLAMRKVVQIARINFANDPGQSHPEQRLTVESLENISLTSQLPRQEDDTAPRDYHGDEDVSSFLPRPMEVDGLISGINHQSTTNQRDLVETWSKKLVAIVDQARAVNQTVATIKTFRRSKRKAYTRARDMFNFSQNTTAGRAKFRRPVPLVHACASTGKWAVISSTEPHPTATMKIILEQGWCLVVLGRKGGVKALAGRQDPRFVHLSLEDQEKLPFRTASLTPKGALWRKNVGYLFAMSQGAKVILDIDAHNEPISIDGNGTMLPIEFSAGNYSRPLLYLEEQGEVIADLPVWNPYPAFNLADAWPRGFPWDHLIHANNSEYSATKTQYCRPVIQQYLINIEPDLDAAYRMKYLLPPGNTNKEFRKLVFPRNVFAPYNAQATVHLQEAFWSLLLPKTVEDRVADIWRSYITQSLLYLMPDVCVMFTSSVVQNRKKPNNVSSNFMEEIPLYSDAAAFIDVIRNHPMKIDDFPSAFWGHYKLLNETGFLKIEDVEYAEAWVADLHQLGALIPSIPGRNTWMSETQLCIAFNHASMAPFAASELAAKYLPLFKNIVMYLDRSTFPNLDLIANVSHELDAPLLQDYAEHWPAEVTSYLCDAGRGFRQTRCLRMCMNEVDGQNTSVLYMADDDFFNFMRANGSLPKTKIWFPKISHATGQPYDQNVYANHDSWHYKRHLILASHALKELPDTLKASYLAHVNATGQVEGHALADCVYVPFSYHRRLKTAIAEVEKEAPDIFSEAGLPLSLNLVAPGEEKCEFEPDAILWGGQRIDSDLLAAKLGEVIHLHALKISFPGPRAVWRDAMAEQYRNTLSTTSTASINS